MDYAHFIESLYYGGGNFKNQITKEKHHLENHFIVVLLISVSQCIKIV